MVISLVSTVIVIPQLSTELLRHVESATWRCYTVNGQRTHDTNT